MEGLTLGNWIPASVGTVPECLEARPFQPIREASGTL
jgi:hypothetical protein